MARGHSADPDRDGRRGLDDDHVRRSRQGQGGAETRSANDPGCQGEGRRDRGADEAHAGGRERDQGDAEGHESEARRTPEAAMTLREQLERDEGRRHTAYTDTAGHLTLGGGHNLNTPLSDAAIDQILDDDIRGAMAECALIPFWMNLSEVRQAVLVNLAFNMGFQGLMTFRRMLAAMDAENWNQAAQELLDSRYAKQVGARADRLALQLSTDQWV